MDRTPTEGPTMSDGAPLMIGSTACFGRQHEEIYKMDTKPSLDAEGLARTRYPRGADCIQVSAGRWITLDVATQEWRWMFYREKYNNLCQVSL